MDNDTHTKSDVLYKRKLREYRKTIQTVTKKSKLASG